METENSELNFNKQISQLENLQKKLIEQQERDENLKNFIESRLKSNLLSFKENFPQIYQKFSNYTISDKYKLFCLENGEINVFVNSDNKPLYYESPFAQCLKQVEDFLNNTSSLGECKIINEYDPFGQIHFKYKNQLVSKFQEIIKDRASVKLSNYESIPCIFMFGIGLGYQIGYLYERITPINIYIIEPDLDIFYLSLCVFDYAPWIEFIKQEHLGLKFYLSDDANLLIRDVGTYFSNYPVSFANKLFFKHYNTKKIDEFLNLLESNSNAYTLNNGFFDDYLFGVANGITNLLNGNKFWIFDHKLPESYKHYPIVVVGNGPSLDNDLPLLKEHQNKMLIIACGTAYSALCRFGIKADIYVAMERVLPVYDSLISISDNRHFFDETLCIAPDIIHPKTLTLFKRKVLGFKVNEVLPRWLTAIGVLSSIKSYTLFNRINPLVSNMGIKTASLLKFSSIYLLGIDNGTADPSNAHSRYSMYYDNNGNLKDEYKGMALNNVSDLYPGNFQDFVSTNSLFKLSIQIIDECVSENPNIKYFNCSNGAKINGAIPKHFADIDWDKLDVIDKSSVIDFIENKMSKSIDVTKNFIEEHLYINKFNEVVDTIIKRLEQKEVSRIKFILMQEDIFAYIKDYVNHGFSLLGCLLGSITQMIASINIVVYSFENEQIGLEKGYVLMEDVISFLKHSKKIYPHILQYIQGEHRQYQEI